MRLFVICALLATTCYGASSTCASVRDIKLELRAEVRGKFVPGAEVSAKLWSPQATQTVAKFAAKHRFYLSVENGERCYGVLNMGDDRSLPNELVMSGDVVLSKLESGTAQDLIVIKSQEFHHSITEYQHLFTVTSATEKAAIRFLWMGLSYESSPAGEEVRYPLKLKSPGAFEYYSGGTNTAPKRFVFDPKAPRFSEQTL